VAAALQPVAISVAASCQLSLLLSQEAGLEDYGSSPPPLLLLLMMIMITRDVSLMD